MIYIIVFALGCVMNALRGGQFAQWKRILKAVGVEFNSEWKPLKPLNWWQKIISRLFDSDLLNALVFFLACALFPALEYRGNMNYEFVDPDWHRAAYAGLAMYIGASMGWGRYIGALGGWEEGRDKPLMEWPPIDKFIEDYTDNPKQWGFLGLTLRGLVWGLLIGLALNLISPIVGGALMGCCYWLGLKWGGRESGWPKSEWIFGGPLWLFAIGALIMWG